MTNMLYVATTGGRNFSNQDLVDRTMDELWNSCNSALTIVHGGASGADACVNAWVLSKRAFGAHIGVDVYMAEWKRLGEIAEQARSRRMLSSHRIDRLIVFMEDADRGSRICMQTAMSMGIQIKLAYGAQRA